ncbi:hypothetical protein GCM10017784_25660 [Deinococcus indicus]|nr:hypothetical protein GCM10017784_25660 [Deinococcus indicus]
MRAGLGHSGWSGGTGRFGVQRFGVHGHLLRARLACGVGAPVMLALAGRSGQGSGQGRLIRTRIVGEAGGNPSGRQTKTPTTRVRVSGMRTGRGLHLQPGRA